MRRGPRAPGHVLRRGGLRGSRRGASHEVRGDRGSAVLSGHRGNLTDVDVSPDGCLIASSDSTGLVRIWNLSTGEALQGIQEHVQNVEFVDERHLLVTETAGPAAYVMTVDVDELLEIARSRVTRDLSDEECRTYLHVDPCPSD
jgi:WD40 repeat protein